MDRPRNDSSWLVPSEMTEIMQKAARIKRTLHLITYGSLGGVACGQEFFERPYYIEQAGKTWVLSSTSPRVLGNDIHSMVFP